MSPATKVFINNCLKERGRKRSRSASPSSRRTRSRQKRQTHFNRRRKSPSTSPPRYHSFMIRIVPAVYFQDADGSKSDWISDGGSNCHATNDENDFVHGTIKTVDVTIDTGGGEGRCTKTGTVKLYSAANNAIIELADTMLLPDCGKKIISESLLDGTCSIQLWQLQRTTKPS